MGEQVEIYVVSHEVKDGLPQDRVYIPLLVGSRKSDLVPSGWRRDCDCEESIAYKNPSFCELTGLFWIWKNCSADVVGLTHYRRQLGVFDDEIGCARRPLTEEEINQGLSEADCLIAQTEYFNHSNADWYELVHQYDDWHILEKVIDNESEDIKAAFKEQMSSNSMSPYNILIAKKELFDEYCVWLFSILDKCEQGIDPARNHPPDQARVFGYLAERLLNVWITAKNKKTKEYFVFTNDEGVLATLKKRAEAKEVKKQNCALFSHARSFTSFDGDFYKNTYSDIAEVFGDDEGRMKDHYLKHGLQEGRQGSESFCIEQFQRCHPTLRKRYGKDLALYGKFFDRMAALGLSEVISNNKYVGVSQLDNRDYSAVYDYAYYIMRYDDIPVDCDDGTAALRHFVEVGMREGRQGSVAFNVMCYKEENPELEKSFGVDLIKYYDHFIETNKTTTRKTCLGNVIVSSSKENFLPRFLESLL